jgi:hypothetical protein
MSGIETALALAGTIASAAGAVAGGISASNDAKAQADLAEMQANEARAVSQREADRKSREAKLIMSSQQAKAAASGGGARDPTVLQLMGDVGAEASYQERAALYEGETRGRGLEAQAAIDRMRARQAMLGGFIGAGSSVISGLSSWSKYQTPGYGSGGYTGYPNG